MKTINIITMVLTLGLASLIEAQPPGGGPPEMRDEQIRERIKTVKIWKLTEELRLSEEQSQRFFPVYNKIQTDREAIENRRRELLDKLDELTGREKYSDKEINGLLDQLDSLEQNIRSNRSEFRTKFTDILTVRQIARLYVFEVRFQRQIQEIIRDTRMEMQNRMRQGKMGR